MLTSVMLAALASWSKGVLSRLCVDVLRDLTVVSQLIPEKSGFMSANTLYMKSKSKLFITTGSKRKGYVTQAHCEMTEWRFSLPAELDHILGGGLETMSVTEVG